MTKIENIKLTDKIEGEIDFVKITNDDGSVTTMTRAIYDAMQAEQSTPIVINEAETI